MIEHVSPSGGNSASSELGLSLKENSVSPELGLAPANSAGGHSFDFSLHDCMPQSRLVHGLERTSVSLEHGFGLDSTDKRAPDVTRSYKADVRILYGLPSAFCHTYYCLNHYD
jgi:hypothetical protein